MHNLHNILEASNDYNEPHILYNAPNKRYFTTSN
jgi:hypothetical protein